MGHQWMSTWPRSRPPGFSFTSWCPGRLQMRFLFFGSLTCLPAVPFGQRSFLEKQYPTCSLSIHYHEWSWQWAACKDHHGKAIINKVCIIPNMFIRINITTILKYYEQILGNWRTWQLYSVTFYVHIYAVPIHTHTTGCGWYIIWEHVWKYAYECLGCKCWQQFGTAAIAMWHDQNSATTNL